MYLHFHIPGSVCVGVPFQCGYGGVVSLCSLKHYWPAHVGCGGWGLMTVWNRGLVSPGLCSVNCNPIRPVVNNIHAPSYKTAKRLNKISQQHLNLDNQYTVINSVTLAQNLTRLNINSKHSLITFDIKDVHIPIAETIDITTTQLLKHNDPETTTQICTLLGVIQ